MQVSNYIKPETVLVNVKVKDKDELFDLMIEVISKSPELSSYDDITREVIENGIRAREKQASTGLGDGYAFPHARLPGLNDIITCLAVIEEPIEYDSFDAKPVKIACMVLAPEDNPTLALKFMSQVVKAFSDEKTAAALKGADSAQKVVNFFHSQDIMINTPITASDIMRPAMANFDPETPLKEITHLMSEHRINAVAITDENEKVVGEITCDLLFNFGVPEFFKSLKSVSFIDEFDPFGKYFSKEAHSRAKDIMSDHYSTMPKTATLLEIVFALTVQQYPKIYVIDNDKLVGIIDQSTVLDKIVNF